jgi:hypothetical protein
MRPNNHTYIKSALKKLSNNSKSVNHVINNKGLSSKLNPDTVNNKQNYGHPSTSQKITDRSVNGENRVTTPRPAPPEWLKCLPLIDTPYNLDLEKLKANLHKAEQKHVSDHPTQRCVHIVAKTTKGHKSENILLQQISEKHGHPSTSQKITHRSVNRVTTPRPAPPEWLKRLPLIDTPYNESSNNPVFRGTSGRRKTHWRSRREKYSDIVN